MDTTEIKVNFRCEKSTSETFSTNSPNKIRVIKSAYSIADKLNFIQLEYVFEHPLDQESIFKIEGVTVFKVHNYFLDSENSPYIAKELFELVFNRLVSNYLNSSKILGTNTHQILQLPNDHRVSLVHYVEEFQNIPFGRPHFFVTIPSHSLIYSCAI